MINIPLTPEEYNLLLTALSLITHLHNAATKLDTEELLAELLHNVPKVKAETTITTILRHNPLSPATRHA